MATKRTESGLVIKSDGKWKNLKYGYEVPKKVLSREFDWLEGGEDSDGFINWRGHWYHTSEFMRVEGIPGWTGIKNESFSSGVLLKLSSNGERYQIASYYQSSST